MAAPLQLLSYNQDGKLEIHEENLKILLKNNFQNVLLYVLSIAGKHKKFNKLIYDA